MSRPPHATRRFYIRFKAGPCVTNSRMPFFQVIFGAGPFSASCFPSPPPPKAVIRLRRAAQNGRLAPGPGHRSQPQATRHGGDAALAPQAGAIPQPTHHYSPSSSGSPSPEPPNRGFPSAPHTTEGCPFSGAQPERGPGGILRRSVK